MDPGQKSEAETSSITQSILTFEQQKQILQMQNEQKRFDAIEREKERSLEHEKIQLDVMEREKERSQEHEKIQLDVREREKERLLEQDKMQLERTRLGLMAEGKYGSSNQPSGLASMVKFLPRFNERDPDVFFSLFESVASDLKWTSEDKVLLLQTTLHGNAQEAFVALSAIERKEYKSVKEAVLKAYELVRRLTDNVLETIKSQLNKLMLR